MQSVKWLAFCVSQSMSRSVLHFFPSCDNASAPYAASCSLTLFGPELFGSGMPRSSVVLEGGRLGHPDGLRLEDAFPMLRKDSPGMFGLEVEISTPQPRLDVRSSGCIVEVLSQSLPVRFVPKKIEKAEPAAATRSSGLRSQATKQSTEAARPADNAAPATSRPAVSGIAIRDNHQVPSLVIVNGSAASFTAAVYGMSSRAGAVGNRDSLGGGAASPENAGPDLPLARLEVLPGATQELVLGEDVFRSAAQHDFVAGRCISLPFSVEVAVPPGAEGASALSVASPEVGLFLVHREAQTRRMSSVLTL